MRYCKNKCGGVTGGIGFGYDEYAKCATCNKWYPKPTPVRCPCCSTQLRQFPRLSKSRQKLEVNRIE